MRNRTVAQPKNAADSAGLERFIVELKKTRRGGAITDSVIPWGQSKVYGRRRMRHVSS
jgi:hypothetical protein